MNRCSPNLSTSQQPASSAGGQKTALPDLRVMDGGAAPADALTWATPAQRNQALRAWRRGIYIRYGESTRALRLCWVLSDLFNAKTGFAFPTNTYLAAETEVAENKVRETLLELERGGALVRIQRRVNGRPQRHIYPGKSVIGGSPTVGQGGEPRQPGHQNLNRVTRIRTPRSQLALAALQAEHRRDVEASREGERTAESYVAAAQKGVGEEGMVLDATPPPRLRTGRERSEGTVVHHLEAAGLVVMPPIISTAALSQR